MHPLFILCHSGRQGRRESIHFTQNSRVPPPQGEVPLFTTSNGKGRSLLKAQRADTARHFLQSRKEE